MTRHGRYSRRYARKSFTLDKRPKLLYVCDFPPANRGGGDTLIYRLLSGYPTERLCLAFSSKHVRSIEGTSFGLCKRLSLMELTGKKQHGFANIAMLLDRTLVPLHALRLVVLIKKWNPRVILTVAHGYLFLAAVLASMLTGRPLVIIVHDDWIEMQRHVYVFRRFLRPLFRWSLDRATTVLAVSDSMAEYLLRVFSVRSTVQWPATDKRVSECRSAFRETGGHISIVFAGMIYGTVHQSIDHLVKHIIDDRDQTIDLHLYSNYRLEDAAAHGWSHPKIHLHEWVPQEVLQSTLQEYDVVFLPVSFEEGARYYSQTSFPSKLADYLAIGRPLLLVAPADAAITRYARIHGFAEVVTDLSSGALERAFARLRNGGEHVEKLIKAAHLTFTAHHDMAKQRPIIMALVSTIAEQGTSTSTGRM